jgi:hypothetical protein
VDMNFVGFPTESSKKESDDVVQVGQPKTTT